MKKITLLLLALLFTGCTAAVDSDWTNIHYEVGIDEDKGVFVNVKPPFWDAAKSTATSVKEFLQEDESADSDNSK